MEIAGRGQMIPGVSPEVSRHARLLVVHRMLVPAESALRGYRNECAIIGGFIFGRRITR
jgi:hypothetical protein